MGCRLCFFDDVKNPFQYGISGSPVQEVNDPELVDSGIRLLIKRDDLIHEHISGNKWRKLKYNLREAAEQNHHSLLTFGGAYSNHIAATAFAAQKAGLSSIGVIRGEDDASNPTLKFARENKMQLHFVSRTHYRSKTQDDFIDQLAAEFGRFFLIPEGGANGLGRRRGWHCLLCCWNRNYVGGFSALFKGQPEIVWLSCFKRGRIFK